MTHLPLTPWRFGEPPDAWLYPHVAAKLDELIRKHNVRTVLEIGTCYGASAIFFAQRVDRVACVDTWGDIPEHGLINTYGAFVDNIRASGLIKLMRWVVGNSHKFQTSQRARGKYDLVYLDAGHTYEDVKQDIEMYGPMAAKVLCGDYDVELPSVAGVIRAVDELVPDRQTHGRLWWKEK